MYDNFLEGLQTCFEGCPTQQVQPLRKYITLFMYIISSLLRISNLLINPYISISVLYCQPIITFSYHIIITVFATLCDPWLHYPGLWYASPYFKYAYKYQNNDTNEVGCSEQEAVGWKMWHRTHIDMSPVFTTHAQADVSRETKRFSPFSKIPRMLSQSVRLIILFNIVQKHFPLNLILILCHWA